MLRRAEAVAPGDEDRECDSWVPMPHIVPMPHSSIKELLNSWRYQTLLSDSDSGVWTTYSEPGPYNIVDNSSIIYDDIEEPMHLVSG